MNDPLIQQFIIRGIVQLSLLAYMTVVFYPLPWWEDLDGAI